MEAEARVNQAKRCRRLFDSDLEDLDLTLSIWMRRDGRPSFEGMPIEDLALYYEKEDERNEREFARDFVLPLNYILWAAL